METVTCNLCGSAETRPFAQLSDLLLERPEVHATLVQCVNCGLVYQNPRPTPAEIVQHYPLEYESYTDFSVGKKRNWLLQKAINYGSQKRVRFVTRYRPQGGRLLDIGCAAGAFMLGMEAQGGWKTYGVELSEEVALLARSRHGLEVLPGTLEQASFGDEVFDVVTMWDVFEHLHDPAATLREVHRVLKPDGIVVLRVPNLASWDARLFGPYWAGLDAPRHLYVFTPWTLERMLGREGFDVLDHSSAIGSYMTFALSVRFWLTAHGASEETKRLAGRALYNPLTRLATAPLFYIPSVTLRGPLVVTTARKRG